MSEEGGEEKDPLSRVYTCLNKLMSKTKQQLTEAVMTRDQIVKEMTQYVNALGLDLSKAPVIHVAGTKGKGSTCILIDAILRAHGYKTGLYTSPHLIEINERVRLGGKPCPIDRFCKHFFDVWNMLKDSKSGKLPRYFQFLTLVAFKTFLDPSDPVDVIILETGVGGRLDATNIIEKPVVTGITKIGYDHMNVLGNTLDAIAREKAGIFKSGVPAFTTTGQEDEAMKALMDVAAKVGVKGSKLIPCEPLRVDPTTGKAIVLGVAGEHQKENASLALALAHTFLKQDGKGKRATSESMTWAGSQYSHFSPEKVVSALKTASWPGRCQTLALSNESLGGARSNLYIDGAHTQDSCIKAAEWFIGQVNGIGASEDRKGVKVGLVFNCAVGRDCGKLLMAIHEKFQEAKIDISWILSCPFDWDKYSTKTEDSIEALCKRYQLPVPPLVPVDSSPQSSVSMKSLGPAQGTRKDTGKWQKTILQFWHALNLRKSNICVWHGQSLPKDTSKEKSVCELKYETSAQNVIDTLKNKASKDDISATHLTLVTGSLYLAGNILKASGFKI